jgi:hypothetical protein
MHQKLWAFKVEEKFYVGVREQKNSNTIGLKYSIPSAELIVNLCVGRRAFSAEARIEILTYCIKLPQNGMS